MSDEDNSGQVQKVEEDESDKFSENPFDNPVGGEASEQEEEKPHKLKRLRKDKKHKREKEREHKKKRRY